MNESILLAAPILTVCAGSVIAALILVVATRRLATLIGSPRSITLAWVVAWVAFVPGLVFGFIVGVNAAAFVNFPGVGVWIHLVRYVTFAFTMGLAGGFVATVGPCIVVAFAMRSKS